MIGLEVVPELWLIQLILGTDLISQVRRLEESEQLMPLA
jgi:hypothetical protein